MAVIDDRLADVLNGYFHNWVVAYMFAPWLRRHWDDLQKVLDDRAEICYNDLMTTTDTPTPEQHVALVDALIPFARATLGQDAHPHDIAYHCWVTLEQGYPITGVDMALVTKATTAFIDNNKSQEG